MAKNHLFRAWFYFRQGWSTYFAFIFAAINTLTVTYYLAIDEYPILNAIFPTFLIYVLTLVGVGIPILVLIGYVHFKRSNAFKAEADINIEANPHMRRILSNTELKSFSFIKPFKGLKPPLRINSRSHNCLLSKTKLIYIIIKYKIYNII